MLRLIRFLLIRIGGIWLYQGHDTDIRDWAKSLGSDYAYHQ